jgi:hypothetical protein
MLVAEFMKDRGVMIRDMELLMKNIRMEIFFKEILRKGDLMEMEKEFGLILAKFIMASGFKD